MAETIRSQISISMLQFEVWHTLKIDSNQAFEAMYPSVLWMICQFWGIFPISILFSPWLPPPTPLCHPSFLLLPPSLHLFSGTQNALSLFPAAFEPRSEGAFWLSHTHTQYCSFRCKTSSAVLISFCPFISPYCIGFSLLHSWKLQSTLHLKLNYYYYYLDQMEII